VPSTTFRHPLANVVLSAFVKEPCQDAIKIAVFLGAPNCPKGLKAYKLVAHDVLEVLRHQGVLELDEAGWYRSKLREQLGG
jgi:hypothetical protein